MNIKKIHLQFNSIASSKDILIKQLEGVIAKLNQTLMTVKDRDEAFVTNEYGKYSLKIEKIKYGQKELFKELWPERK